MGRASSYAPSYKKPSYINTLLSVIIFFRFRIVLFVSPSPVAEWVREAAPEEYLLQLDLTNTFNTFDRVRMLDAVWTHAPRLYRYAAL